MAYALDKVYASILAERKAKNRLRQLTRTQPGAIDFSSNDYLSLSSNNSLKAAYLEGLQRAHSDGRLTLGSGGSRLLDGNHLSTETLEQDIAAFHGAPAGLLFNSGFEANTGLFSCAPQEGDLIVYDELIHASVHDGMRLSRADKIPFKHNSVCKPFGNGDLKSLDQILFESTRGEDGGRFRDGAARVFVAVESVYSMGGDLSPLQEIVQCVERRLPAGNGHIIVDEAHSTGWMGDRGRGLVAHLGLECRIWARVHTFGKAMGCSGAVILCSSVTRHYLINYARSLIYTTAMGYPALAAIQTAYTHLKDGMAEGDTSYLFRLIEHTHQTLMSVQARNPQSKQLFYVNEKTPESPIIPIFSSRARDLARYVQRQGFMVRPIVAPTVPAGTDRVRVCLHAGNTFQEVAMLCQYISSWLSEKKHGLECASVDWGRSCGETKL